MKQLNFFQRLRLSTSELEQYYIKVREERFNNGTLFRGIKIRDMIHPLILLGLYTIHFIKGQKIKIIGDLREKPTNKPVIYAATHIGWDDIEMIITAITDRVYLLFGDPGAFYKSFTGCMLDLNGLICVDLNSKIDRFIGKESCVKCLEKGQNILIFPEGAWNLTESTPVMPLYAGTAEIALRTGAEVILVAIEQYGKEFVINIGKNISFKDYSLDDKNIVTDIIYEKLSGLKWDIWCSKPNELRSGISDNYREKWLQEAEQQMQETYTLKDVEEQRFHTKFERETEAIKKDLENIKPNKNNAFLFNKRLI